MATRKNNNTRKLSRKNRKNTSRKNRKGTYRKNRKMFGGNVSSGLSLTQGKEFAELHRAQHGGGQMAVPAPVGYDSLLPQELRAGARIEPLDSAHGQIAGMRDADFAPKQTGGRRKSVGRKRTGRKSVGRKNRKGTARKSVARKNRKGTGRKSRRCWSGGYMSPVGANSMLLSPSAAAKAGTADFSL